jgi:hypothetical protein
MDAVGLRLNVRVSINPIDNQASERFILVAATVKGWGFRNEVVPAAGGSRKGGCGSRRRSRESGLPVNGWNTVRVGCSEFLSEKLFQVVLGIGEGGWRWGTSDNGDSTAMRVGLVRPWVVRVHWG